MRKFMVVMFFLLCIHAVYGEAYHKKVSFFASSFVQKVGNHLISFDIQPWPAKIGIASLKVQVADQNGKPVNHANVEVALVMPSMGMSGDTIKLSAKGPGTYLGKATFSMATEWSAKITVKFSHQPSEMASFHFNVVE